MVAAVPFGDCQISDLTPDQLSLALGLRFLMRARGLDPQKDAALKKALPAFLRSAKSPKAQVRKARPNLPLIANEIYPRGQTQKVIPNLVKRGLRQIRVAIRPRTMLQKEG